MFADVVTPRRASAATSPYFHRREITTKNDDDETFDVAISFAGSERDHAETLAKLLHDQGVKVFYDNFYGAQLWGKHLTEFFDRVYRKQSRFCVMFISKKYRDRPWTTHERRSALSRAIEDRGREYILPIMVEQVELDGLQPDIGYLPLANHTIEEIARMVVQKVKGE